MAFRLLIGLAVFVLLAGVMGCAPQPRSAVEPLPEGLEIVAEYEVPRRRIEGPGLCLVIAGRGDVSGRRTLEAVESHLVETKGWRPAEGGQFIDWAPVSLTQRGPRGLVAGLVDDFLRLASTYDDCRALESEMNDAPAGVVVSIWLWER